MRFDVPTQVSFLDEEGQECYGICYGSVVICGCCGAVYNLEENLAYNIKPLSWVDIADAIKGT